MIWYLILLNIQEYLIDRSGDDKIRGYKDIKKKLDYSNLMMMSYI